MMLSIKNFNSSAYHKISFTSSYGYCLTLSWPFSQAIEAARPKIGDKVRITAEGDCKGETGTVLADDESETPFNVQLSDNREMKFSLVDIERDLSVCRQTFFLWWSILLAHVNATWLEYCYILHLDWWLLIYRMDLLLFSSLQRGAT